MIHFDIEDRYQDEPLVGRAISLREGVLLSVVVHAVVLAAFLLLPSLAWFEAENADEAVRQPQREEEEPRFVFVRPMEDLLAETPPERADASDADRRAQAPEVAPDPVNENPFSLGNSRELVEGGEEAREEQPASPSPPSPPQPQPPRPQPESEVARLFEPSDRGVEPRAAREPVAAPSSPLGDALRNLQRYVQNESFVNPQGGADPGQAIQFDTKGVEFGPWLRRFVSQVRRNWFVPYAAMAMRGRVVLQFYIHKDGRITDVAVVQPSSIDSFNNAAYNAIITSNPTEPLPPEYPDEAAFFTVTFFYNEPGM